VLRLVSNISQASHQILEQ